MFRTNLLPFTADRLKNYPPAWLRSIALLQRTTEYASVHRFIERFAPSCLLRDLKMIVIEFDLFALELRCSFFEKSFHAFIAILTGEGLRQEFALESQSVRQREL
jgi:hypothetical protein